MHRRHRASRRRLPCAATAMPTAASVSAAAMSTTTMSTTTMSTTTVSAAARKSSGSRNSENGGEFAAIRAILLLRMFLFLGFECRRRHREHPPDRPYSAITQC